MNCSLSYKSYTVVLLAVHLPQQQPILYQDGQEAQAIERAALRKTTLTSWFQLNKNYPSAHNNSDSDIPQYYVFDKSIPQIGRSDNMADKMLLGNC
ncbi:hypothetical protein AVEN_174308-1 [Araneus ventricosus]|uniref:Uncharacterized protein n=1 Tax=Araneus ventricosus TaxID=182803 RepID=A0A4Y2NWN6_ARAVE|nr:hypothetical protein AVEN_174308-1 [Araneus ventricosus]